MSRERQAVEIGIEKTVVIKGPDHQPMYFPDLNSASKRVGLTQMRDKTRMVVYAVGGVVSLIGLMSMPKQTDVSIGSIVETGFLFFEFGSSIWLLIKSAGYLETDEKELQMLKLMNGEK